MAGNTLGDLLKAGQLDLLKQVSSDNKASEKKPAKANVAKPKEKRLSSANTSKDILQEDYRIFHSYVRNVVLKNELYDTMFDYGDEESFSAIAELYDNPVCRDIIDYFACCFFNGEYDLLDAIANDCERGNDNTPDDLAVVLGHQVPITYREEYDLLSLLCSTAVNLDGRFDDEPLEETVIVYKRPLPSDKKVEESQRVHQYQHPKTLEIVKRDKIKEAAKSKPVVNLPKKVKQSVPVTPPSKSTAVEHPPVKSQVATPIEKPKKPVVPERRYNLVEIHNSKTIELKNYFESNFRLLGLTDEIVELYRQEKYRAIIVIFLSSCRKYFIRQDSLDEESYSRLWDKAHDYIYEFINGSKRPSVRPHPPKKPRSSSSVIGYRKRSFSSHIATSGVWGRIAAYGGTNGRIIRINAGHGRR